MQISASVNLFIFRPGFTAIALLREGGNPLTSSGGVVKKTTILIFVFLMAGVLNAGPAVDLGPKKSLKKISITYRKQDLNIKKDINPMMFSMAFCERLAYSLGIYKYISFNDLVGTGLSIYSVINSGSAGTLTIHDFKDGKDLIFNFHYMGKNGQIMLLCTSNYVEDTHEIVGEDKKGDTWAMGYYLMENKLVNYSYIVGDDKKPAPDLPDIALANYYMQDADAKNDAKVETLILRGMKHDKVVHYPVAYAILSQYYMMADELDKAQKALDKVLTSPVPQKGLSREELYYITAMELGIVKKCYEQ
jgi:hypothetical protein